MTRVDGNDHCADFGNKTSRLPDNGADFAQRKRIVREIGKLKSNHAINFSDSPISRISPCCVSRVDWLSARQARTEQKQLKKMLGALVPASPRTNDQSVRTHALVWRAPVSLDLEQPLFSNQPPLHMLVVQMAWERKCRSDSDCPVAPPEAMFPHEGAGEDYAIFTALSPARDHRAHPVRISISRAFQGILCRVAILPTRALAACLPCSACEHPNIRLLDKCSFQLLDFLV